MKLGSRKTWLLAAVAFLAALAGVLIGRSISDRQASQPSELHELLHEELDLDTKQLAKIEELETRFAIRRRALELELRSDNARLAAAIQAEHGYGPRVTAEIDRSHRAMGLLQKETLSHIFAMRAVLRPNQAEKFDRAVVNALTADGR
jgi:Spy/CpxP family protein refolding chaperone